MSGRKQPRPSDVLSGDETAIRGIMANMQKAGPSVWARALSVVTAILIIRVAIGVLFDYHDYFPPNFQSDFLRGRESYFWGPYQWAFFTHVISGPVSLVLGTLLVSE